MRVVILGASGFLGSWVARALVATGHQVTAPLRSASAWRLAGVPLNRVAVTDDRSWHAAIRDSGAETLISLDWGGVSGSDRDGPAQRANLERLTLTLRATLDTDIRRIVVAGSQAELGPREEATTHDAQAAPVTAYGRTKIEALGELQRHAGHAGVSWRWARVYSVFGPMDNPTTLLSQLAAARQKAMAVSSGRRPWSFLDAEDAARAFGVLVSDTGHSGIINVASPSAPPLRHSIEIFTEALAPKPHVEFGATDNQPLEADVRPLMALGWQPSTNVDGQLRRTAEWYMGGSIPDPFLAGATLPSPPTATS